MTKIWITKYALTKGITEAEAEISMDGRMAVVRSGTFPAYYLLGEWFTTKENAVANANVRLTRKIASVLKQLKKLQALKFEL